jgi:exopolyphosphatase/guanosine-5'-triphosphate,3'-diphosphate pyrophosphatase
MKLVNNELSAINLAAIDIGTNSFHMIIVKLKENGNFEIIDRVKEVIRLGEGSGGNLKYISETSTQRAVESLKRFKTIAESHNAKIRAVATSAVREANNRNEFITEAFEKTGLNIEVISGYEEARLIYLGILKAVPVYSQKSLIIDIGGGSTEFLIGKNGISMLVGSIKIGAVRLTNKFFPDFISSEKRVEECRQWVNGELYQILDSIKLEGFKVCVGSSGTIMSIGLMLHAKRNGGEIAQSILNNFEFTCDELKEVEKEILVNKSLGKRKKIVGLDEKRAEIITAGVIILSSIFDFLKIEKMIISGYSLREGIIIDSVHKLFQNSSITNLNEIRKGSIINLAENFRYDRKHSAHVAKLALKIFDDLKDLHKMGNEYREYLEAASILHDIGYHISHTNHHHHSAYIIKNGELLGFNELEINIISQTARYHRKSHPKNSHVDYAKLSDKDKAIVKSLSSILRIADSLERIHKQNVLGIEAIQQGKKVHFKITAKEGSDLSIELWNLERRKILFEETFGLKTEFHVINTIKN